MLKSHRISQAEDSAHVDLTDRGQRAREGGKEGGLTDHDSREQTHSFTTVGVRDHVSIADGQEGDGDKPHGSQEVTGHILSIVVPGERDREGERYIDSSFQPKHIPLSP